MFVLDSRAMASVFGVFLMSDFGPEHERKMIEKRSIHQFTFRHFARTLATVLSICSEIDNCRQLGNRIALIQLGVLLGGYANEASGPLQGTLSIDAELALA
jgi:hypothetical protein